MVEATISVHKTKGVSGQGHFVKEQRLDQHVFPPDLSFIPKGLPMGHLRPLGFHRISEGKLRAFNKDAPFSIFDQRCSQKNQACINLKRYSANATDLWGDKYLAANFGDLLIDVEIKYDYNSKFTRNRTTLKQFLQKYHYEDWSLKSFLPQEMHKDLLVPDLFHCPSLKDRILSVQLWISSGPSSTAIFYEDKDTYHCFLTGRADFIVINGDNDKTVFNMTTSRSNLFEDHPSKIYAGYSHLDTEKINMFEHADIQKVSWKWGIVKQNDCIFIPAGFMQQVRTYGRSISVAFAFSTLKHYGCDSLVPGREPDIGLQDGHVLWEFKNGSMVIEKRHWTKEMLQRWVRGHIKQSSQVPVKQIEDIYYSVVIAPTKSDWTIMQERTEMDKVRQNLAGKSKKKFLTLTDVEKWSSTQWMWMVESFNAGGLQKAMQQRRRRDEL